MNEPDVARTEEKVLHECEGVQFFVDSSGEVAVRVTATGTRLPEGMVSNLLLLDIARTLHDIRSYGIAQHTEIGQRTWQSS